MKRELLLAALGLAAFTTGCGNNCSINRSFVADADGDGFPNLDDTTSACEAPAGYMTKRSDDLVDCDDNNAGVNPEQVEVCDAEGLDEDCNGLANDADSGVDAESSGTAWYPDSDGDGHGDANEPTYACDDPSIGAVVYLALGDDCDDGDASVNPDATEVCDGGETDEDCDGLIDDEDDSLDELTMLEWYADADGDGFGVPGEDPVLSCLPPAEEGYGSSDDDCDDTNELVYPGAPELCDGILTDCRGGEVAEGVAFIDSEGVSTDLSATFADGVEDDPEYYRLADDGTLVVCDGTWYTFLEVAAAEVSIVGDPSAEAVLHGGDIGRVVDVGDSTVTLDNLTITGGYTSKGGGIACEGGELTATDVDLVYNNTTSVGGAIYLGSGCQAQLSNVLLDHNEAPTGAAVYATGGSTELTLSESTVSWSLWEEGGGVTVRNGATVNLDTCEVSANDGTSGGALQVDGGTIAANDTTISENDSASGPGLYMTDSEPTDPYASAFTGSNIVFQDNEAGEDGGAVYVDEGASLVLETSQFLDNSSERLGGAVFLQGASFVGTNLEFQRNTSDDSDEGAAINFRADTDGTMDLVDPVFAENETYDVFHWELQADYTASSGSDLYCSVSGCSDD